MVYTVRQTCWNDAPEGAGMKRCDYKSCLVMLGIKTRRAPIEGDIANNIRNAVARVANGQLSAQDKAVVRRAKAALDRYDIHWEL
jgi:hypothetical protein